MRRILIMVFTALTVTFSFMAEPAESTDLPAGPVVVELFTSEGCASCPPAEAHFAQLQKREDVIALAWHVDYWNSAGWRDPFAQRPHGYRQASYAAVLDQVRVYTPQIVVDGKTEFNGTDHDEAKRSIKAAKSFSKASVKISCTPVESKKDTYMVTVQVADTPQSDSSDKAEVLIVITEDALTNEVAGGENQGRVLHHTAVVRTAMVIGTVENGEYRGQLQLGLDPAWRAKNVHAVVLVQWRDSRRIIGADRVSISEEMYQF